MEFVGYHCWLMARNSILAKLGDELGRPLKRQSQVLYVMAEIRKVIEHEQQTNEHAFEVLEFFCNWVLHITISRKSSADNIRLFLRAFDMKEGMELLEWKKSDFVRTIMHLEVLRRELGTFLHEKQLPCDVVHDFRRWSGFIYLYTAVVAEVPLRYTKTDLAPTEVEELTVAHQANPPGPQKLVRWFVRLKNGQEFNGGTLYGQYLNEQNHIVGMPDFWDDEFQL
jgi:hypothetical protein